ncbi:MAG: sulfatase, partial [Planctomycetia bacterium]
KTGGKNVIGPRLYNLAKDIHEDNDLSKSMPEKVNELQAKWNAWDKLNVQPTWGAETKAGGGKAKKKKESDD